MSPNAEGTGKSQHLARHSMQKECGNDCISGKRWQQDGCKDDPIVKYQNSELLDSALTVHHIPHQYIQYKTGGHGFGASDTKGSPECRQWKKEFLAWVRKLQAQ